MIYGNVGIKFFGKSGVVVKKGASKFAGNVPVVFLSIKARLESYDCVPGTSLKCELNKTTVKRLIFE